MEKLKGRIEDLICKWHDLALQGERRQSRGLDVRPGIHCRSGQCHTAPCAHERARLTLVMSSSRGSIAQPSLRHMLIILMLSDRTKP